MSESNIVQPLDQQFRVILNKTTQKEEKIPALDRFFKVERQFLTYVAPPMSILNPSSIDYQASLDQYEERLKIIEQDLKWLLSLPYQKFWCQIVYDTFCQKMIDSYLKLAPRPYDMCKIELPDKIVNLHNSIHKYVFLVCLRMSTYKESKENFLSQQVFADLIYNNYLFDIPKILDLCVLYDKNPVLNKLVENLFNSQSKYHEDFKFCIKDIIKAIETSKKKLRSLFELDSMYDVNKSNKPGSLSDRISQSTKEIMEIVYYLTDFVQTLSNLISIQTQLANCLYEQKFEQNLKDLMETTIFEVEDIIVQMRKESNNYSETACLIKMKLSSLKYQITKIFNKILQYSLINPIVDNIDVFKSTQQMQAYIDNFVKICCDILDDKRFLCYYEEKHKLSEQIDLVFQISNGKLDKSQYDFMIESLRTSILEYSKKPKLRENFGFSSNKNVSASTSKTDVIVNSEVKPGASSNIDSDDLLVQSVLDFLPDLDKILIKKCLKYFNNNVEHVINAFLENNLPVFPDEEPQQLETSEISSRKNIYDNDEFDVFNKDKIDLSKIHIGKKNTVDNFDLDNKEDVVRREYDVYEYNEDDVYEDEYDDTYDSNTNVNDDFFAIKPLNQKLDIKKRDIFEMDSDEEEDEENDEDEKEETQQATKPSDQRDIGKNQNQALPQRPQNQRFQGRGGGNQGRQEKGRMSQDQEQRRPDDNFRKNQPYGAQHQAQKQQRPDDRFQRNQPQGSQYQEQKHRRPDGNFQRNQQQDGQYQAQRQQRPDDRFQRNQPQVSQQREENEPRQQNDRPVQLPQRQQFRNRQGGNRDNQATGEDTEPVQKTEEEIKRERRWKNDNKATIAHHNRKYLSMKKTGF